MAVVVPHHGDVIVLVAGQRPERERGQVPLGDQAVEPALQFITAVPVLGQPARVRGGVEDAFLRRPVGVLVVILGGEVEAQVFSGRPEQAGAAGKAVGLVQPLVQGDVAAEAVVVVGSDRGAQGHGIADGKIDRTARSHQAVVAHSYIGLAGKFFGVGRLGNHVDGAARGVLAEQGALGAAQHFDAFEVQEIRMQGKRRGHVDAVQVIGHGGVGDGILVGLVAHAAYRDNGLETFVLGDGDAGGDTAEVHEGGEVAVVHVFARQSGHGLREVLQAFGAFFCSHGHLFQPWRAFLGRAGQRRASGDKARQDGTEIQVIHIGRYAAVRSYTGMEVFFSRSENTRMLLSIVYWICSSVALHAAFMSRASVASRISLCSR